MAETAAAEVVPYEPVTDQERAQREEFDRLLAGVQADKEAQAYTLPELLGQPVPYEAIEGLYFKRPKLGHKMDLMRRFTAIQARYDEDKNEERATQDHIRLIQPYAYLKGEDGALRQATTDELTWQVFDDVEQVMEFFAHIYTSKRAAQEEGEQGNA